MPVRPGCRYVRSTIRRCVGTAVIAAAILAKPTMPAAQAGGYKYTIIFGPGGGGPAAGQPYRPPAVNDTGTVVVRTDCSSLVLGDGTTQRNALAPLSCRGDGIISMNNAGMVALDSAYFAPPNQSYDQIVRTLGDDVITAIADQQGCQTAVPGSACLRAVDTARFDGYSINNSHSVALGAGGFIFVRPNGDPRRQILTVFDPTVPTAFGPVSGDGPSINDNGAVAFSGRNVSGFVPGVFLDDGGPLLRLSQSPVNNQVSLNNQHQVAFANGSQVLVVDGGPIPRAALRVVASSVGSGGAFSALDQPSLNDNGTVAFLGSAAGAKGIFTGPDPTANKVVQVGESINLIDAQGHLVPAQIQNISFSRDGLNNRGQIAFSALTNVGQFAIRADPLVLEPLPPGAAADSPIPPINTGPPWQFQLRRGRSVCTRGCRVGLIDPAIATGYTYTAGAGAANFAGVLIPAPLPGGDATFQVEFASFSDPLLAGTLYDFTAKVPGGVAEFTIRGIDPVEHLDPNNPLAFVTGLLWTDGFDGHVIMTPLTVDTAPQPCDTDNDGDVDTIDLLTIRNANGQVVASGDPRDGNGDQRINVADLRYCQLRMTRAQ